MVDYKRTGIILGIVIISVLGASRFYTSDILKVLEDNPKDNLFLLTEFNGNKVELIGRSPDPSVDYTRYNYDSSPNAVLKGYNRTDLLYTIEPRIYRGTELMWRVDEKSVQFKKVKDTVVVVQEFDFIEPWHRDYLGSARVTYTIKPFRSKPRLEIYNATNNTYRWQLSILLDNHDDGERIDADYNDKTWLEYNDTIVNWTIDKEHVTSAYKYGNGNLVINYERGAYDIDPEVVIGSTKVRHKLVKNSSLVSEKGYGRIYNTGLTSGDIPILVNFSKDINLQGYLGKQTAFANDKNPLNLTELFIEIGYNKSYNVTKVNRTFYGWNNSSVLHSNSTWTNSSQKIYNVSYYNVTRYKYFYENVSEYLTHDSKLYSNKQYVINYRGSWLPGLGERAVDVLPTLNGFVLYEYAWWNTTYNERYTIHNSSFQGISYFGQNITGGYGTVKGVNGEVLYVYNDTSQNLHAVANETTEYCYFDTKGNVSSCPNPPNGSINHWTLDQNGDSLFDFLGDITLNNTGSATTGNAGFVYNATHFQRSNSEYIESVGSVDDNITDTLTWCGWLNPDTFTSGSFYTFYSYGGYISDGYLLQRDGNDNFVFGWDGSDTYGSNITYTSTALIHLCFVVDSGTPQHIMINDTKYDLVRKIGTGSFNVAGNQEIEIGRRRDSTNQYFDGSLDDVRTWNRALSDKEVRYAFNSTNNVYFNNTEKFAPFIINTNTTNNTLLKDRDGDGENFTFYYNYTDSSNDTIITNLIVNGTINQTNSSTFNNTPSSFTVALPPGLWILSVNGTNGESSNNTSDYYVEVDDEPWYDTGLYNCRNITLTNSTNFGTRSFQPNRRNITGLSDKLSNNNDVVLVNDYCRNYGSEQDRTILDSGSDYATIAFTFSGDLPTTWSVYWNNTTTLTSSRTNESKLQEFDEFNDGSFNYDKWINDTNNGATSIESGGLLNLSCDDTAAGDCDHSAFESSKLFTDELTFQLRHFSNGTKAANIIGIKDSDYPDVDNGANYNKFLLNGSSIHALNSRNSGETEIGNLSGEFHEYWINTSTVNDNDFTFFVDEEFNITNNTWESIPNGSRVQLLEDLNRDGIRAFGSYDWILIWNNTVNLYTDVPTMTLGDVVNINPPPEFFTNTSNNSVVLSDGFTFYYNYTDENNDTIRTDLVLNDVIVDTNFTTFNNTPSELTATGMTEGLNKLFVNGSNGNSVGKTGVYYIYLETEVPDVNLVSPANESFTLADVNFTFNFVDEVNNSALSELVVDGSVVDSNSSTLNNTNTILTATGLSEGNHTWYVNVTDSSGTNQSEIRLITVDLTPPNITLTSPDNNTYWNRDFNISYTFEDSLSGVDTFIWSNDSYATNFTQNYVSGSNYSIEVNVSQWFESITQVNVFGNDTVNNINKSLFNFTIDVTPPTNLTFNDTNNSIRSGIGYRVYFNVSDVNPNTSTLEWFNSTGSYNHSMSVHSQTGNITTFTFSFSTLGEENHTFRMTHVDKASNVNKTVNYTVRIENKTPSFESVRQDRDGDIHFREDAWVLSNVLSGIEVSYVYLEHNASGTPTNYTISTGTGVSNYSANHTIDAANFSAGEVYYFKYWANNSVGWNNTGNQTYTARNLTTIANYTMNGTNYFLGDATLPIPPQVQWNLTFLTAGDYEPKNQTSTVPTWNLTNPHTYNQSIYWYWNQSQAFCTTTYWNTEYNTSTWTELNTTRNNTVNISNNSYQPVWFWINLNSSCNPGVDVGNYLISEVWFEGEG